jgi:fumarate reductase flavoprotein subunit|tara:strand:+ start:177 stop:1580 length:1404 start_codon:yes stop_codon:yes gene_type:complete
MDIYDVICVGAGSAGLPLAIRAAQNGARVLQIEADNRIGGTLHWSSGQIAAAGTRLQKEHGVTDTPEEHFADAQHIANGQIDPVVLKLFVDNAADTIDWLMDLGFKPAAGTPVVGEAHEAYSKRRYLWGDNAALSILDVLRPVHEKLVAAGKIDLLLEHRLSSLITDDAGAVKGINVDNGNNKITQLYGSSVVLACGGYAAGVEMWNKLNPEIPLASHCNPFSLGDGIKAAQDLDAIVDGTEKFLCTFAGYLENPNDPTSAEFLALSPKSRNIWEIFVDNQGKRFMTEDHQSIDYRERALLNQPEMKMNIVFDSDILENSAPLTLLDPDVYRAKFGYHPNFIKANTIEELAEGLGCQVSVLTTTIQNYNASVEQKKDKEFNKFFLIRKIENPPFYGIKAMGVTVLSPAGLAVDADLRVIKQDGNTIPNLYAAGEILGFGRTSGNAFVGGLSLTPALTFGKLLGERLR